MDGPQCPACAVHTWAVVHAEWMRANLLLFVPAPLLHAADAHGAADGLRAA